MSTLRITTIEAKSIGGDPLNEVVSINNSSSSSMFRINGSTVGVTSIGINTEGTTLTVDQDGLVSFSGVVSGIFSGSGSNLSNVSTTIVDNTTTNATYYPTFVTATSGTVQQNLVSSSKLQFNPSLGNFAATQFTSLSDQNKKENIRPIENAVEITKQLEGVRFNWKENGKESLGLVAQEVEKVLPELVETADDGTKSVSYGNIIGILIEAIKEQQVLIDKLMER